MKFRFKILWAAVVVLLVLPLSLTLVINNSDIKQWLSSYVLEKTGRIMRIQDVGIAWSSTPEVYFQGVKMENAPWADDRFLLEARRVAATISLSSLFSGVVRIQRIEISGATLWLQKNPQTGRTNLAFGKDSGKARYPLWLVPEIAQIDMVDSTVIYRQGDRDWLIAIENVNIASAEDKSHSVIDAVGRLEGMPITFSGTTGSLIDIVSSREVPLDLSGKFTNAENPVSVSGVVQDMKRWYGLNLWFNAKVADLADLSTIAGRKLPHFREIEASWELVQPEFVNSMKLESISLYSTDYGPDTRVYGEIDEPASLGGISLTVESSGVLTDAGLNTYLDQDKPLALELKATITGSRGNLQIQPDIFEIHGDGASMSIDPVDDISGDENTAVARMRLQLDNLNILASIPEQQYDYLFPLQAQAILNFTRSGLRLGDIRVDSESADFNINATGYIDNPGPDMTGMLKLQASTVDSAIPLLANTALGEFIDKVSLNAELIISRDKLSLENLAWVASGEGVDITGQGRIGRLSSIEDVDITMQGSVDSLSQLEANLSRPLPFSGRVDFSSRITNDSEGDVVLSNINVSVDDPGLTATATGSYVITGPGQGVSLEIASSHRDIDLISAMLPDTHGLTFLSVLFPVESSMRVQGRPDADGKMVLSVAEMEVKSLAANYEASVSGAINNLFTDKMDGKLQLKLKGEMDWRGFLAASNLAFPGYLSAETLSGNFTGSGDLTFQGQKIGLDNLQLMVSSDHSRIGVTGSVQGFRPLVTQGLVIEVEGDQLAGFVTLPDDFLNLSNPVTARLGLVHVENEDDSDWKVRLAMSVGTHDLDGEINIGSMESPGTSRKIRGSLHFTSLDLAELLVKSEPTPEYFSSSPLELGWLENLDLDIDIQADSFNNRFLRLANFTANATAADNRLSVTANGKSENGDLDIEVGLEKIRDEFFAGKLFVRGDSVGLSSLTHSIGSEDAQHGEYTVRIDVSGHGNSIADMAASSDGQVLFKFEGARMRSQGFQLFGRDLFSTLLIAINPVTSYDDLVDVECGVLHFSVEDGVATSGNGLALKLSGLTLLGGGIVQLDSEEIHFVISTKARKGLGINTNTLAKMVRIGGTINSPKITTDVVGLLETGVALGAAFASGGLSLIAQGLYDRRAANADVCELAADDPIATTKVQSPEEPEK